MIEETPAMDQVVARLDDLGKPAWIAAMVLGFILFWPIGLAILAYMIWSGRMGCARHGGDLAAWQERMAERWQGKMRRHGWYRGGPRPSGNAAFDEYREQTLSRLEEEEREFREYLRRLRMARDREEFDRFMNERRRRDTGSEPTEPGPTA
jgi:hypothetical protein